MLTRIVLFIALVTPLHVIVAADDSYILTVAKARAFEPRTVLLHGFESMRMSFPIRVVADLVSH